ncbi:MAG TPA: rhodanese-like domain-containing protein [Sunxiuqinia sp.]|nr:rhodanese-like domain-containing protein [Sunxiuqinia sp.]
MHVHESNPWRTIIALSVFVVILIVGFLTMRKPLLTYELDMKQSLNEAKASDTSFYPWQLDSVLKSEKKSVVLFDIRDHFVYGQGHIPGAENLSAQDLSKNESIERLENLKERGITVVLYGENQLHANGPCMLFRQVGLDNVKELVGGYQYYKSNKDKLAASINDSTLHPEKPRYDFAEMAAPKDGAKLNINTDKKPVVIKRRKKTTAVAGGC